MKHLFYNDYSEGAHSAVLSALSRGNLEQEAGYGHDESSRRAADLIRERLGQPDADIHFVSGGTQANLIAMAAMLKPYQSVIAAASGHINVHESGAIEATGHKINLAASLEGKLSAESVRAVIDQHTDEHMVRPGAVFVSQSTELGSIYSKNELQSLLETCRAHGMYLYLDGARLGSALASPQSDMGWRDLGPLLDMFYIGGTKNGALLGEALVICHPALKEGFRHHLKQRGALLAKGRVFGSQFEALFQGDLYLELAKTANDSAQKLFEGIRSMGFGFLAQPVTNQVFPVLPDSLISELQKDYGFYVWQKVSEGFSAIRLVTSWATPQQAVEGFLADLNRLKGSQNPLGKLEDYL